MRAEAPLNRRRGRQPFAAEKGRWWWRVSRFMPGPASSLAWAEWLRWRCGFGLPVERFGRRGKGHADHRD